MNRTNTASVAQSAVNNADSMLRDLAYILRLTRSVKAEILAERATIATQQPLYTPVEHDSVAV